MGFWHLICCIHLPTFFRQARCCGRPWSKQKVPNARETWYPWNDIADARLAEMTDADRADVAGVALDVSTDSDEEGGGAEDSTA